METLLGCRRGVNKMINVWIDDLTPCLKDTETGDFVPTEVVRIRRKTFYPSLIRKMVGIQIGKSF